LVPAVPAPRPDCWLHPDVEVHPSPIAGLGLFARAPIAAGTPVSRLGGRLVRWPELRRLIADPDGPYVDSIPVTETENLLLPPRDGQPSGARNGYGNHACDPALWWTGPYELTARRDIAAGDEITNDYGTSTADPSFTMTCTCGSRLCRHTVSGDDWRRPELRERYDGHWIPVLLERIRADADRAT
jgi:SET domain-containing protein